ncbi:MAG: hypothetical protein IJL80_01505, partial [Treponema sp.]|nr:hypothetical protein [Treponema sp.]
DDVRFYTVEMKDQIYYDANEGWHADFISSQIGGGDASCHIDGVTHVTVTVDTTYLIVEINGYAYLQAMAYSNKRVSKYVVSFHPYSEGHVDFPYTHAYVLDRWGNSLTSNGPATHDAGFFNTRIVSKIFSKDLIGY